MSHHPIPGSRFTKKTNTPILFIKILLVFLWGLFLLVNTWTINLEKLMNLQSIGFTWVSHPNYSSFFYFYDFTLVHTDYLKVKLGHFIGFAVMDILLFNLIKNHKYSIWTSFFFAFLTEFFQLFFGRDGRLYDLIIDTLGILTAYFFIKWQKNRGRGKHSP